MKTSSQIRIGVLLVYIILGGYIASVAGSLFQVSISLSDQYQLGINSAGTIGNPLDDEVNVTLSFLFANPGLYEIHAEVVHIELYIHESANETFLPIGASLGEIDDSYIFPAQQHTNETFTIVLNTAYLQGLFFFNATIRFELTIIQAGFAGIEFDLEGNIFFFWDPDEYTGNA